MLSSRAREVPKRDRSVLASKFDTDTVIWIPSDSCVSKYKRNLLKPLTPSHDTSAFLPQTLDPLVLASHDFHAITPIHSPFSLPRAQPACSDPSFLLHLPSLLLLGSRRSFHLLRRTNSDKQRHELAIFAFRHAPFRRHSSGSNKEETSCR